MKIVSMVHFMSPNISKMLSTGNQKKLLGHLSFVFFFGDVFELWHAYHTFTAHLNWDEPCFKCSGATCDQGPPHWPAEAPVYREVMPLLVPVGTVLGEDRSLRPTLVGISRMNTLEGYRL